MNRLLKAKDVAEALGVSPSHVYGLMRNGDIRSVRFGRSVRIRIEDLDEFIAANRTEISPYFIRSEPADDAAGSDKKRATFSIQKDITHG